MNYLQAMEYKKQVARYGSILGLKTMKELMERLGNPEKRGRVIHIGGTNGKGSTAAFISSVLAEAGLKTGRYTSPVLLEYTEMIQVMTKEGTACISRDAVARHMTVLRRVSEEMAADGFSHPTVFELETAMAFLEFADQGCDASVVEVGLGGRLDATNVVEQPDCAVITAISMDHMQQLGSTLLEIAREKAGIIKEGGDVASYDQDPQVMEIIESQCRKKHGTLYQAEFHKISNVDIKPGEIKFDYKKIKGLQVSLSGGYQIKNAVTALEALWVLEQKGYPLQEEAIRNGFKRAAWRGRFETIRETPLVIADGAHNPAAAAALYQSLLEYQAKRPLIMVIGMLADKDQKAVLENTLSLADKVITITPGHERGLSSFSLYEIARKVIEEKQLPLMPGQDLLDGKTMENGLLLAEKLSEGVGTIVIFGSLSLLKDAERFYTCVSQGKMV